MVLTQVLAYLAPGPPSETILCVFPHPAIELETLGIGHGNILLRGRDRVPDVPNKLDPLEPDNRTPRNVSATSRWKARQPWAPTSAWLSSSSMPR